MSITMKIFLSIGLPIYNGEEFLEKKLSSVLTQTHENFELIISDNASTDKTQEICKKFQNLDKRIKYFRQNNNIGPIKNFGFVLNQAKYNYFLWTSVDDFLDPTFIEKNLHELEKNSSLVASVSKIGTNHYLDRHQKTNDQKYYEFIKKIRNLIRPRQFLSLTGKYEEKTRTYLKKSSCMMIYSIFRTESLKKSFFEKSFLGNDWAICLNILKFGELNVIDEILIYQYERGLTGKGMISSIKAHDEKSSFILPWYPFTKWCMKNLGIKFIFRNIDYFIQLNIEGFTSLTIDFFYSLFYYKKYY